MPSSADILNHALSQQDRLAQAPDPSRVRVDDRSLAHLLSLAVDHGKFITFYDLTNAPDGDWSALFSTDPAIALALQASLDPNAIEQEMQAIGRRLRQDDRPLVRPEPWQDLVALIRHLLTTLRRRALREGPLATLLRQVDSPVALVDSAINLSRFLESTGLDLRLGVQPILLKETELRRLENLLRDFLGVLLATLDTARQDAARDLQVELTQPGHSPHVALYIAFARLFQSTQARLNGFPDALLRFYHQQVLRQETIPDNSLRPDHLLLAFRRKPGADTVLVPRQTPFSAGVDGEGLPVIFATDQDLEVQASELRGMVTMRVRGRVRQIDGTEGLAAVDAVWLTAMTLPLPYPAVGPVFPLFGHDQPRQTPCGDTSRGVLGFAIASPLLLLEGGQRLVQLTLRITPPSLGWLAADSASRDPDALRERIRQSLEQALSWEYTTAAGLEPLSPRARILSPGVSGATGAESAMAATTALASCVIELDFALPPSAPSWRDCPDWGAQPLLVARFQGQGPAPGAEPVSAASPANVDALSPLALLSLLRLEELQLAVAVQGLQPSVMQSSVGRLDASQPLPIFGPSPVCGSFFSVGAAELAGKPLDAITLRLQWHGLPISRDGFRGHYSGYRLDGDGQSHPAGELFDNDCFRVDLHLDVDPSVAEAAAEPITLPLFQTAPAEDGASSPPTGSSALAPTTALTHADLKGRRGVRALRLVLSAPLYAFGDALYALNCLDASRRLALTPATSGSSPAPVAGQPQAPDPVPAWPNPPWCPTAAAVLVDYRCSAALSPSVSDPRMGPQLLHLTPLQELLPVSWSGEPGMPLLPQLIPREVKTPPSTPAASAAAFDEQHLATVVLTFSQPLRQISLLFGLTTSGTVDSFRPKPALRVEARVAGDWLPLPDTAVQDGTSGLSRTGLLQLTLPGDHTTSCLRLRVSGLCDPLPELVCLEPNAVWATWQGPGGRQSLNRSLEAGTVTAALVNVPALVEVRQPLPSQGGVAPASDAMEKVCLAERLRHKDRAIQADDYALLLLRAFPVLWQVAVLPARNAQGKSEAGCVTIIPIPGPDSPTISDPTIPSCDAAFGEQLLTELQPCVSPFVRLQVACPPYCRLSVCATVVVMDDARMATSLQLLQGDLVRFLSPWPAPELGPRPKNYYEESAVSQFIRDRSYIKSIDSLELQYLSLAGTQLQGSPPPFLPIYYTSALRHALKARPASVSIISALDRG